MLQKHGLNNEKRKHTELRINLNIHKYKTQIIYATFKYICQVKYYIETCTINMWKEISEVRNICHVDNDIGDKRKG